MRCIHRAIFPILIAAAVFLAGHPAAAQGYKVEKTIAAAPQELSAAVRETLAGEGLRVSGPSGVLCEIWLRKIVPAKAAVSQELGITFGQLAEGTLVGAVRFPGEVQDYRRQKIKPGVYTLRYALIPNDGNHLGVAPQRDFLLLGPASADSSPANVTREETLNLGRKATGSGHPSVWSLAPAEGQPSAAPTISHQDDGDLWVLQFPVQMQSGTATPTSVVMALVVWGHAPEA